MYLVGYLKVKWTILPGDTFSDIQVQSVETIHLNHINMNLYDYDGD